MGLTLRFHALTINNHPVLCPECASPRFTLDEDGPLAAWPARGNCPTGCTWEDPLITGQILRQIDDARTGRARSEDDDTFEIQIGSTVLAGIIAPELTATDVKTIGRIYWKRLAKPVIRRHTRRAKTAAKRAITRPVKQAAGAAKSAALGAAWQAQAGGWEDQPPTTPCGAGCDDGYFHIESRLHSSTGAARVRCSVCRGTGHTD